MDMWDGEVVRPDISGSTILFADGDLRENSLPRDPASQGRAQARYRHVPVGLSTHHRGQDGPAVRARAELE